MLQRALIYLLEKAGLYEPARIVCRKNISSLKRKIDSLTERIEKCEIRRESIRNSESVMFASDPEYQKLGDLQGDYFRRRYSVEEKYSRLLRIMDGIRQKG